MKTLAHYAYRNADLAQGWSMIAVGLALIGLGLIWPSI